MGLTRAGEARADIFMKFTGFKCVFPQQYMINMNCGLFIEEMLLQQCCKNKNLWAIQSVSLGVGGRSSQMLLLSENGDAMKAWNSETEGAPDLSGRLT